MNVKEGSWWMVFTVVCLVSLVGLLEYEGQIDIFGESKSSTSPLENTSDEMHPLSESCLNGHDGMAMHFHPYLTIVIDGDEYAIAQNTGIDTETCPDAMHMTHTHDASGKLHVESHKIGRASCRERV